MSDTEQPAAPTGETTDVQGHVVFANPPTDEGTGEDAKGHVVF